MVVSHGKNLILSRSSRKSLDNIPERRLYGRRIGKPLGKQRAEAIDRLLPLLCVPEAALNGQADLDPARLFSSPKTQIWMEIGFGNGEHLLALLRQYPEIGFLGAEPFINGMAALLKELDKNDNIRVLMDDAMRLIASLKDQSLDRLYILNPDPWPKKRHHKRRIVSQENLSAFARVMKPGAEIIMATDVDELAEWMEEQCTAHPGFEKISDAAPPEWIETRYAFKGRSEGRKQSFLIFRKKAI